MCVKGLHFFTVLSGLAASGVLQVSGITIYTPSNMDAVNGTDVRLKCTFHSTYPINPDVVTISWSFRPLTPGQEESVFHYQQRPYPPLEGIFRNHIVWAGDIMGRDASITIQQVKFNFNGTYICQVKNPPDVHGTVGEIRFRVVTTAPFSELLLLVLGIAGGIAAVVIFLIIIVSCRQCKRRRQRELEGNEEAPRKERKDPTVCHPLREEHPYQCEMAIKLDSSDVMISEVSAKCPGSSEEDEGLKSDDHKADGDDSQLRRRGQAERQNLSYEAS